MRDGEGFDPIGRGCRGTTPNRSKPRPRRSPWSCCSPSRSPLSDPRRCEATVADHQRRLPVSHPLPASPLFPRLPSLTASERAVRASALIVTRPPPHSAPTRWAPPAQGEYADACCKSARHGDCRERAAAFGLRNAEFKCNKSSGGDGRERAAATAQTTPVKARGRVAPRGPDAACGAVAAPIRRGAAGEGSGAARSRV